MKPNPQYGPWNWHFSFEVEIGGPDESDKRDGEILRVSKKESINSIVLSVTKLHQPTSQSTLTVTFEREGVLYTHSTQLSSTSPRQNVTLGM